MDLTFITVAIVFFSILLLRGGQFHNHLVLESETIIRNAGFSTHLEHPIRLPDGGLDFIDLLAKREEFLVCIEVETTARYVLTNVLKARQLGLPLLVVVPNRKVQKAVQRKLDKHNINSTNSCINILLLGELYQKVMK